VSDFVLLLKDGVQQMFGPTAEVMQKLMPAPAAPAMAGAPAAGTAEASQGA